MPLPRIQNCILCEGIRPEINGKATILGFLGILPDVNLLVSELGEGLSELMFVISLRGPSDRFALGAKVIAPDSSLLVGTDLQNESLLPPLESGRGVLAAIGFDGLVVWTEGTHSVQVTINGKQVYENFFNVRKSRRTRI